MLLAPYRIRFASVNLLRWLACLGDSMAHRSLASLRLDQRLLRRRGWIGSEELDQALSELPDVSDKIAAPSADADDAAPQAGESAENEGETP